MNNEFDFTQDDFENSSKPYEYVYSLENDKFQQSQVLSRLAKYARKNGVSNFLTMWKEYQKQVKQKNGYSTDNSTNFSGQPIELLCGDWQSDDFGVTGIDGRGMEIVVCPHPIMPVQRLTNIDTDCEKMRISYKKRGKAWRSIIVDKPTLSSANKIVQLSEYGILVNSENAKMLVKYLSDIDGLNDDKIPEINSVGRLGWISDNQFSPYADELVFDGEINYKSYFDSVRECGKFNEWIEIVKTIRSYSKIAKIALSASFASVLVKPCNCLPFFTHIWGGTEAGKTVALMLAASVWADPAIGRYIHTFNSTNVAQEMSASFVNSMPLIMDELQIVGDRQSFDKMIYQISEGHGKSRGAKTGGLQKETTWANCIITSGEQPMTNGSSFGGAVNRIIEIDCKDEKIFKNPVEIVDILRKNFGFAGKIFVEKLQENFDYARKIQKSIYAELQKGNNTEKQIMAASLILTADKLIDEWIFNDGQTIAIKDIQDYLSTLADVSANERAYEFLTDCIAMNSSKFLSAELKEFEPFEYWGKHDKNDYRVYIIKTVFDRLMKDNGFNGNAFLSWAKRRGKISTKKNRNTSQVRIGGLVSNCVCLILPSITDDEADEIDDFVNNIDI